jgi:metallo-beta-lactamase class B
MRTIRLLAVWVLAFGAASAHAQAPPADWLAPHAPFRIAGNLYYVGGKDLASYLVVTPAGNILINSNFTGATGLIRQNIGALGFKYADTKLLLISHAHADHAGGSAQIIKETHAQYLVMDDDVAVVESGGRKDFAYPNDTYPTVKVDRVLHDEDEVTLGGTRLVALKTPGHTRGCTTWALKVPDGNRVLDVVIAGGWFVNPSFRLLDRPGSPASYPGIAADYRRSFGILKGLHSDVFLGAHGSYFHMQPKYERMQAGEGTAVWIDPEGYAKTVAQRQADFEAVLKQQQAGD